MLTSSTATSSRGLFPLKMSVRAGLLVVQLKLWDALLVEGVGSSPVRAARRSSIRCERRTAVRLWGDGELVGGRGT